MLQKLHTAKTRSFINFNLYLSIDVSNANQPDIKSDQSRENIGRVRVIKP